MEHIIICDIDGTIADVRHRLHHIRTPDGKRKENPDWTAFHAACVDDPPFEDVLDVVRTLWAARYRQYVLYFFSGRNEVVRTETEAWLDKYFVQYQYTLYMRKADDRRPDTVVKLEMMRSLGLTPRDVLCIFDDRQCVVDMWRERGFRVMQVAAWEE